MIATTSSALSLPPEVLLSLIQNFPTGILLCTMEGAFLYANDFLVDMLGYEAEELLKLSYWELTPQKYQEKELLQMATLQHTGRYGPYEKEYIHRSGRHLPIRLNGIRVQIEGQELIWSMIENMSAETVRHATSEIQRSYGIHTEKMSALKELVAGVAHEINNPINFIHGNLAHLTEYTDDLLSIAQLCQTHRSALPLELQDQLDEIDLPYLVEDLPNLIKSARNGSERIRHIVKSLRRFSRLDHDGEKTVDIHEGIEDCLLLIQQRFQKLKVDLIRDYASLPPIQCFPGELNQALLNILNNAIDALKDTENPTLKISTERYGKHLSLRIKDNGRGMEQDIAGKIFNPFFTTKPVGEGTGLGLTTSHQIITEQHKGFLSFHSVPGEGTEFMIQLPYTH
jgi:PAS domain S-box-containing protein